MSKTKKILFTTLCALCALAIPAYAQSSSSRGMSPAETRQMQQLNRDMDSMTPKQWQTLEGGGPMENPFDRMNQGSGGGFTIGVQIHGTLAPGSDLHITNPGGSDGGKILNNNPFPQGGTDQPVFRYNKTNTWLDR